jgi:Family of unknown function (DUF5677)
MAHEPLPAMRMSTTAALVAGGSLAALVEKQLPLMVQLGHPPEPMRLIGPAMLARGAGTVQAIGELAPLDRAADAAVLVRVLLEHVITFAWLAADEDHQRYGRWLKGDSKQRLTMHDDLPDIHGELLAAPQHATFSDVVERVDGELPNLRARAQRADADWAPRLPSVLQPGSDSACFLGLYRVVYRYFSAFTHAGLISLKPVIKSATIGADIVTMETSSAQSVVSMAALLLGLGLYVSSEAQGWPESTAIDAIFAEAAHIRRGEHEAP